MKTANNKQNIEGIGWHSTLKMLILAILLQILLAMFVFPMSTADVYYKSYFGLMAIFNGYYIYKVIKKQKLTSNQVYLAELILVISPLILFGGTMLLLSILRKIN